MVKRALFLLSVVACAPAPLDRSKFPERFGLDSDTKTSVLCVPVRGAYAVVKMQGDTKYTGELLAADSAGLALLEDSKNLRSLSARYITRVELRLYSTVGETIALAVWGGAGTVSGLTHGFFYIFSGPTWIGVSLGATLPVAYDQGRFATTQGDLSRLYQYARFPAGLPESFDPLKDRPTSSCD